MTKPKPQSSVAKIYYRDDGAPRWEVKVRRTRKGKRDSLPSVRYPVNPKARPGDVDHLNRARAGAEAYTIREWQSLKMFGSKSPWPTVCR